MDKICIKCKRSRELNLFSKHHQTKDGLMAICKLCQREYYLENKAKSNERSRLYRQTHKEAIREYNNFCYRYPNPEERTKARLPDKKPLEKNQYYNKNREKLSLYRKTPEQRKKSRERYQKKRETDAIFCIKRCLSERLRKLVRRLKAQKGSDSTYKRLGVSPNEFKIYLESKFQPGMTWENYGFTGWQIDHIIPCASFDLTKPEEQDKCFHYTNLQPLWATENNKKSDIMSNGIRARDIRKKGIGKYRPA